MHSFTVGGAARQKLEGNAADIIMELVGRKPKRVAAWYIGTVLSQSQSLSKTARNKAYSQADELPKAAAFRD